MKHIFFAVGLFLQLVSFSQISKDPVSVTPEIQKKIRLDIEKDAQKLKQQLEKAGESAIYIEFSLDTFRVERFTEKWIDLDYSNYGMQEAGYAAAKQYDSLLNKYYRKLLAVMKGEDKKALVQAQKSWILFRDNEMKLVATIGKEEYSGSGTIQQLTESNKYLNLIKNRTVVLFGYLIRATQNE